MADVFVQKDIKKLLENKYVVFLGDSNTRALYKDFLCLLHENKFIGQSILKNKMENTVFGDQLVHHGEKTNGRDYQEERSLKINKTKIEFYFITRVYNNYVEWVLDNINKHKEPDVIIMNSCLWDMCRWGANGVKEYQENLKILMKHIKKIVSENCLFIWLTTPPLSQEMKGGFLLKQLEFLKYSLRFHVMEANKYARKIVVSNGYDVLDVHYHLKSQIMLRAQDGIHWLPRAVRFVTNLLLTHISLAWGITLPHRFKEANLIQTLDELNSNSDEENETEAMKDMFTRKISENARVQSDDHPIKRQKQENKTSTTPKSKKKKKSKNKEKQSHHAFFQRQRQAERKKRIASWQSASTSYSPITAPYSPNANAYSPIFSRYEINNTRNDQYRSSVGKPFNYKVTKSPLLSSPQFSSQNSPISHLQYSRRSRRPLLPQLYAAKEPAIHQIDWASNKSIPYGTYF